ncbi:hypothetical protein H4219_004175 [Mycoemilia scoparia]|uniref:Uncharacterized protein n=1 Tax=Mycoemilia scoparia TaxID=417184 RepID=A0A9W8DS96_9FUNG|nr:hypothetical protein H4219_004175 [Mycoemilia scoparia]
MSFTTSSKLNSQDLWNAFRIVTDSSSSEDTGNHHNGTNLLPTPISENTPAYWSPSSMPPPESSASTTTMTSQDHNNACCEGDDCCSFGQEDVSGFGSSTSSGSLVQHNDDSTFESRNSYPRTPRRSSDGFSNYHHPYNDSGVVGCESFYGCDNYTLNVPDDSKDSNSTEYYHRHHHTDSNSTFVPSAVGNEDRDSMVMSFSDLSISTSNTYSNPTEDDFYAGGKASSEHQVLYGLGISFGSS